MIKSRVFKSFIFSVLLVTYVLLSCPFSVSALDLDWFEDPEDDVIYQYNEDGSLYAIDYPYDPTASFFALNKPHYPFYDDGVLGFIPWDSFPSYIRAIAYCTYYNLNFTSDSISYYRSPFIMVTVDGSNVVIRAGWDVGLWYRPETGSCTIGFNKDVHNNLNPKLYMCTLDYTTAEVKSDWTEKSYQSWGNSGNMYNYSGSGINISSATDCYVYGANAYLGSMSSGTQSIVLNSDGEQVHSAFNNTGLGFLDMQYKGFPATFYNEADNLYINTFVPFDAVNSECLIFEDFDFGLNNLILKSSNFIPLDNLPYGTDSGVIAFQVNNKNTYQFIVNAFSDCYVFRNPAYSDSNLGKVNVSIVSSSPIYRIGYTTSGGLASVNGHSGLIKCDNSSASGSTSYHKTLQYFLDNGYYVYTYNLPAGFVLNTVSRNLYNLMIEDNGRYYNSYGFGTYPGISTLDQFILQEQNSILDEQNSILDEQNSLIDEGNQELSGIHGELTQSGDSNFSTTLDDEALSDYNEAESDLVDDYNPDNLEDDLDIELDDSALKFIWDVFDDIVTADNQVFALFISCLAVGIISLILGR